MSKDLSITEPAPKRAHKTLNKKEREDLSEYLKSVDNDVLMFAVHSKLLEQPFSRYNLCKRKVRKASTNPFINPSQEIFLRFYRLCYPGNVLQFGRLCVVKCWADTGIFDFAFAVTAIA